MAEQNEKDSVQTTSGSGEHREKDLSIMDYSKAMGKLMDIVCICKNIVFFLAIDSQKFAGNHIMLRRIQINLKFHLRRKILL